MRIRDRLVAPTLIFVAACSSVAPESGSGGDWVGSITTEGEVTTVVTESGSVWGEDGRLVEEASIGVDAGEQPYMLARVASVAARGERIYVLETRPPTLRVYDMAGTHLFDIGSEGQGPGELQGPMMSMVLSPEGDVFVRDDNASRMSVFSPDGKLRRTWSLPGGFTTVRASVMMADGTVYVPRFMGRDPSTGRTGIGMVPYDADGSAGEPLVEPEIDHRPADFPPIVRPRPGGFRRAIMPIPFMPRPVAVLSPKAAWVVGVGSFYRFEIRYFDGAVTAVARRIAPVRVGADEAAESRRRTTARARSRDPEWTWEGPDVPDQKPFFDDLHADQSGRVWVRRRQASIRGEGCGRSGATPEDAEAAVSAATPARCWRESSFFDLFDSDGRYLGEVPFPPYFRPFGGGFGRVFMRDDVVLMEVEDDAGTVMVKRYRLTTPRDGAHP